MYDLKRGPCSSYMFVLAGKRATYLGDQLKGCHRSVVRQELDGLYSVHRGDAPARQKLGHDRHNREKIHLEKMQSFPMLRYSFLKMVLNLNY